MTPNEDRTEAATSRTVGDLMTLEPVVIRSDASLSEAVQLMDLHAVGGLPVVDGAGDVVGVITTTDLVHALAHTQSAPS